MIRLEELTKAFGDQVAVDHLSLEVPEGTVCVLVGPSGCGKTTTMKMVNRLVEPTSGRVVLDGEDVSEVDPVQLRRRIGYVIQQVGLFPHRTVAENVATVPRLLGWSRDRATRRTDELLELVGLDPDRFGHRYPHQLSGGQRQRVGVARALGADPPVLLMDEPFGAIDPITRSRLQQEFLRLQAELRKTVVFVTHDIEEAVSLGDRIAILRQGGVLEQYDTPAAVLGSPASDFVADFVGADRGLKRLGVTSVDTAHLDLPPVVSEDDSLAAAARAMAASARHWAAVVDDGGRFVGWLDGAEADGDGTVAARTTRGAAVSLPATLKQAMAELLKSDRPWVAVTDQGRFVGVATPETIHSSLRRSVGQQGAPEGDRPGEL
jgi:osmoprotectant transport system ATP-binding protein